MAVDIQLAFCLSLHFVVFVCIWAEDDDDDKLDGAYYDWCGC